MAGSEPIIDDGKRYTLSEARKRQAELVKTVPTGVTWGWIDTNGNGVVFN